MIPKDFITEWRAQAPWTLDRQVEQDLAISRALVELFQNDPFSKTLAFRGGTALYNKVTRALFEQNLTEKRSDPILTADMTPR